MGGLETTSGIEGDMDSNESMRLLLPLERVLMTANGNLQRIVRCYFLVVLVYTNFSPMICFSCSSSYYATPVSVKVLRSSPLSDCLYVREADLFIFDQVGIVTIRMIVLLCKDSWNINFFVSFRSSAEHEDR
jgi:hypothetical protein